MTMQQPTAIVTGAAGGLGRVITRVLLEDGFLVAMVDLSADALQEAAADADRGRLLLVSADITDETAVQQAIRKVVDAWGRVDVLVNNAGVEPRHDLATVDRAVWDATIAVNLTGPLLMVKHCAPVWREQQHGRVVNIGSRTWASGSSTAAYVASKAGIIGLSRTIASELGPSGVTSNVVAPSFVRTPLNAEKGDDAFVADFAARFAEASPLRRLIDPVDVAHAVAFLASDRARNITGEVLHVAAGSQLAPGIR